MTMLQHSVAVMRSWMTTGILCLLIPVRTLCGICGRTLITTITALNVCCWELSMLHRFNRPAVLTDVLVASVSLIAYVGFIL